MRSAVVATVLLGCGRIGFAPAGDAPAGDAPAIDTPAAPITYVASAIARDFTGATDSFAVQARHAGDAFVFDMACLSAVAPTAVSLTAPGWTIAQLDPIRAAPNDDFFAASFAAIAPDTSPATMVLSWSATCGTGSSELGDELANNDPTGGAATFDAHLQASGAGACNTSIVTGHANDAIWAACYSGASLTAIGPGFTKASDDQDGDWSAYEITTDPAGSAEPVTFANTSEYVLAAIAIAPR